MAERASKKRKLETDDSESQTADDVRDASPSTSRTRLRRSDTIYMEDGNVVLTAENVAFRVYKGLLAHHSSVFRDMFGLVSEEGSGGDRFDGCPVVAVSDTVAQLESLLEVVFHPVFKFPSGPEVSPLHILNVLLLSHKYMMDNLNKIAREAIQPYFPDTVEKWEECDGITPAVREKLLSAADLMYAIDVARRVQCRAILPTAFFLMSSLDLADICGVMPKNDLATVVRGRESMLVVAIAAPVKSTTGACLSTVPEGKITQCVGNRFNIAARIATWALDMSFMRHGLQPRPEVWNLLSQMQNLGRQMLSENNHRMCGPCGERFCGRMKRWRGTIWCSMPQVFSLGQWSLLDY